MDKTQLGAFIAENRKTLGLTQKELAARLHVTDKAVSKWERGLSYPDVTLLEPLASVFGLTVTELVNCTSHTEEAGATREDQTMKNVLQLSTDSVVATRKRGRRWIAVLGAACLLLAATLFLLSRRFPLSEALSLKWGTRIESVSVIRAGTANDGAPTTTQLDDDQILRLESCLRDGFAYWHGFTKKSLVWNTGTLYTLSINYNNGQSSTCRILNGMLYTDSYAYRLDPETAAILNHTLESFTTPSGWVLEDGYSWERNAILYWREGQYDIAGPIYTAGEDTDALRRMVTNRTFIRDEDFAMGVVYSSDWFAGGAGKFILDGMEYTYFADTGTLYCNSTMRLAGEPLTEEELDAILVMHGDD